MAPAVALELEPSELFPSQQASQSCLSPSTLIPSAFHPDYNCFCRLKAPSSEALTVRFSIGLKGMNVRRKHDFLGEYQLQTLLKAEDNERSTQPFRSAWLILNSSHKAVYSEKTLCQSNQLNKSTFSELPSAKKPCNIHLCNKILLSG